MPRIELMLTNDAALVDAGHCVLWFDKKGSPRCQDVLKYSAPEIFFALWWAACLLAGSKS